MHIETAYQAALVPLRCFIYANILFEKRVDFATIECKLFSYIKSLSPSALLFEIGRSVGRTDPRLCKISGYFLVGQWGHDIFWGPRPPQTDNTRKREFICHERCIVFQIIYWHK